MTTRVDHRHSIYDSFTGQNKCGIYVLHFSDGTFYIGQSNNIPRRYLEHRKKNSDIAHISYKLSKENDLDRLEAASIAAFEGKYTIRNISFASYPQKTADLDILIPPDLQKQWLICEKIPRRYYRQEDLSLRVKYKRKFAELMEDKVFINTALPVMQKYVSRCLLDPCTTEISFWGCSCLPDGHIATADMEIYSRINIYWQEVFTVGSDLRRGLPFFSWHLEKSSISDFTLSELIEKFGKFETLEFNDHYYKTGGSDQFNAYCENAEEALDLLDNVAFVNAIKRFNLRLMRKGSLNFGQYHCMDLADLLITDAG